MTTVFDIRNKIETVLRIVSENSNDNNIVKYSNIIRRDIQRECIYDRDLYNNKNFEIVKNLFNFLKFRQQWERCFRLDYADSLYYCKNSRRDKNHILSIINQFFCEMDNIVRQLEDIIGVEYKTSCANNICYNDELPKHSFHSKRILTNK
jgi:hypothetical protein